MGCQIFVKVGGNIYFNYVAVQLWNVKICSTENIKNRTTLEINTE